MVGAYLKAYERALQWQNKNLDEAVKLLAASKKLDEETIRISLTNNVATNLPISPEANKSQQTSADLMFESGDLKEKLDVTKVIDNSYIEKALKEYKAENPS
ncbi:putative aliphatic sulfonates-binding protein precursor [compost metagenome]